MKIVKIIKSNHALTSKQGEKVRDRVIKKLYYGKRVTLDCGGLVSLTTDFIRPVVEILELYAIEYLKQNFRTINLSTFHAVLLRRCYVSHLKSKRNDR